MWWNLSQTDHAGKDMSGCIATVRYCTDRMRQKLLVVASGVLVKTSTPPVPAVLVSPVDSKPASRGRIKTGHSEALYSYQVFCCKQGAFQFLHLCIS
ncbi:MAG: hypothetical protein WBS33_10605, partial [Verrucomicrobiia bacterium]